MFSISSDFIGNFKNGDNINYNLDILNLLYQHFNKADALGKKLLCKPITILLISIIEAVLYDFYLRINNFTAEGVGSMTTPFLSLIRFKQRDQLEKYIHVAEKHDLFDMAGSDFYEKLDLLRNIRNRIHIQNMHRVLEENEWSVFTLERKFLAEKVLEFLLMKMNQKYPRPTRIRNFVNPFNCPWEEHFNEIESTTQEEQLRILGF